MVARIFNGYTGIGGAMVAAGWPLAAFTDDIGFWIDLIIKMVALIIAAVSAKKAAEKG